MLLSQLSGARFATARFFYVLYSTLQMVRDPSLERPISIILNNTVDISEIWILDILFVVKI